MDNATRLQYLEAMGIDVWVPRAFSDHAQTTASDVVADSAQPEPLDSWEALQAEVAPCTKCDLCKTRTQTVFGSGNKNADWMIIGEGPGQNEDQQGLPFVGKAGLLLTEMLRAIGLDREEVFIANIVKCRPPANRDPKPIEIETCKPYLIRQMALLKPKIIVVLGRVAAQALLNTDEPISKLRGKIHTLNDTPVVVVYHPAYLLRSLLDKRKAWTDLKLALQTYKTL
ncbi:MAG: uracil-DNA glycosylase [Methylobacter sp.]|uniref:uracil-DNA glycosylase n=1 Tax=Methylobacter sp. TaxID=2051955 RepID=UPI002731DD2A|nr:uracil-DNA glycosylase [Methylobacter sp.]MDP1665418.1 uracil-DNA glycosylase [Methylobacter sp.]MDP1969473.1 uracil-DNA glycosylase [Methylobacter sp.]